jgi:hypothetical protein
MSPPGWNQMTPSTAVKSRAEDTRRQLLVLSTEERLALLRKRRQRQALCNWCIATACALASLSLLALSLLSYVALRAG